MVNYHQSDKEDYEGVREGSTPRLELWEEMVSNLN